MGISVLSSEHRVENFTCGRIEPMDQWLIRSALNHHVSRLTRVFVMANEQNEVIGFFTLSGYCLEVERLSSRDGRSFKNKHSIPAHYLGRLAVHKDFHGQGVGPALIMAMFKKYVQILELTTSNFLCLDADNEGLAKYYERFGFKRAKAEFEPGMSIPMYLKSSAILEAVEGFDLLP